LRTSRAYAGACGKSGVARRRKRVDEAKWTRVRTFKGLERSAWRSACAGRRCGRSAGESKTVRYCGMCFE